MITIRSINGEVLTHFDNDVPNGNPYFEPVMTDDMESLVSSFSFSVPLQLADTEYLTGMNQVLTYDRQGDLRLFIISDVYEDWNTTNGVVKVDCEDVSITEMNNIVVNPFEAKDFNEALTKTFKNSGWKFKFAANWREVIHDTFILEDYTNMRDVLAQLKDTYECQFKFMAQENEYGEITRVVEVFKSVGNDNGKYFYYNRDLLGIERDISFTDVKTAIHPYYVGYNGKVYTLANFAPAHPDPDFSKDKESPLIVNKAAHAEYDDGNSYRIMPYKTEVQGDPELVYREAIKELKKHAEPIYTYTVNALLLQNMIEWEGEDIDLGDTVWMKERVGNRELGLEARVVAYEYHEDDPSADKVTFSNFKEIDTRDVEELSNRIFFAYANSADGHLDFSTDDSVGKAYMGVYTSTVTQQSTDPDTYKWTRIKGEDGNSAPTLSLTTSQQVMKFRPDGTPDGDQTILFTAVKQNSTEAVEWEAIPYRGEAEQPAITLEGTGDTRTLSSANWDRTWTRVQVTVTMGALKDIQTVVQVADGATGASGKAIVGFVTNESTTFAASTTGTVSDYTQGNGKFVIYEGTTEVTSGVLYAKESNVGINLVIDATTGEYTVANMTQDQAQAVVKATYKGVTITKFLSFAKSKQGAKGDKGDTGRDGIAGKDGVGLRSTAVTYAASTSGTTSPATGWQEQVPTVAPDNFLWTRTVWTYSDGTSETGYSVAKMGRDGAKGDDGIAGKDGVGIADTLIEYAVSTSGTTRPTSGWATIIPTTPQGQYLWTRTTWTYTDSTTEQGFTVARQGEKGDKGDRGNDGIAGKDGVGLRSTSVTYAKHTTANTPPSTGWQEQVPTVPAGQYLWTKTVWNYTDNTSETGYSVARMGQDGAKGDDGIAGKDGVGIKNTVIEYAVSTSGTVRPTSNWSTAIPNTPAGQYLWTRTTWTYTDNTTEQGFTVARQGEKGDKGDQGIAGPKGADGKTQYTHIAYADNANGGGFSQSPTGKAYIGMYVDFEELDSSDPTKYAWSLIKGADGEQGVAGPKGEDGKTPYFHTAYTNSTDFGAYDYSGNPNLFSKPFVASNIGGAANGSFVTQVEDSVRLEKTSAILELGITYEIFIGNLLNNTQYTLSYDVLLEPGATGTLSDCNIALEGKYGDKYEYIGVFQLHNITTTDVYQKVTSTFMSSANMEKYDKFKFRVYVANGVSLALKIKNVKIERGSTATPYQPNLLDAPWYFSTVPLGENILRTDAGTKLPITTTEYQVANFVPTGLPYTVGQKYTFTMKATKPATQNFGIYLRAGSLGVGEMKPVEGLTDVWQITFTVTQEHVDGNANSVNVFQIPQTTKGTVKIEWAKLEKGDTRTPNIDNYKYLGNYTDFVQADSLNPTQYSWSQIKGDAGETQYTHIAYANSSDGVDGFTTVYPNLNLLDGTKDFSGTWKNSSDWVTDGTYKGLTVKKRTWSWNGIYKQFTAPKDGIYTFSAYIKSSGNSANVYRYGAVNATSSQAPIQQAIGNNFDWTRDSVTLNLKANDVAWVRYEITGTGADSILWTAGHKYELSSTPTPYMPSDSEAITDDFPSYIGQYTDFTQANSTNPSDYTWSLIRGNDGADGQDGAPAKLLSLQADSYVMKFDTNGNIISGQTISLSAIVQNMSGTTTWLATPYIGTAAQPPLTLAGSGNTRTISGSQWGKTVTKVVVKVTLGDFEDTIIINKLQDGAKGQDGADGRDGVAGKDGVGLRSTAITYAGSANGTTPPSTGWQTQVPTVPAGQFLWTRTIWTYTDNSNETGYSVAKMGQDGARGNDGIAGKDGVGIKATKIEYAVNTSGTVRPTTGWSTTIPNTPQGQYLWTRTTWTYTDNTTEQGYSVARQGNNGQNGADGVAGKDGVGLRSTSVTYAGSANGTTPPSTGWNTKVPTVPAGQYLWTKTVWTYTDSSSETGYSVARMGQNGNNGKDGIAGKDGVGIKTTVIEYAVNTSGTTRPTSGWSTSIPTVPQGQYLWTRTTWTYTDNTTEQGFTVARQGSNGANGTNGTNGANAISAFLSNETVSLPANAAGVVSSFATAKGTMMVYEGLNRVTSGVTFALGAHNNTTATVDASGNFAVTAMTADSATVVINATYKGKTLSKTFSLSKAKQGVQGVQGTMGIAFYSPTEPTGATVTNGATWFKTKSASDDTVIGIYTRKSGAWKQTPLASGTLAVEQLSAISANIGNVTAGNLTGVKITGASFINPFDFTDQTNNHIQGTTEISNSELDISGTANAGTAGERKFHTTVAPLYFEATYSDAADNLIRSLNMSSSGFILNEVGNRVTTSLSSGQFQAIDNAKGKSVITSTNNINITDSKNTAVMSPSGFVFRNRKNIHLWQGTGTNVKSMPNLGRITFGTYQSVGWGMLNEDIPLRVHNSYTWQAKRKIKLEIIAQVNIQDASSDWVYFTAQFGTTTATDKSPRQIITIGRISATKDSGDNRIPLQNTILCTGYFELNEGEYLSLCGNCRNGKNCGNVTGMSITFREIFST